jgi:hypothetical protein
MSIFDISGRQFSGKNITIRNGVVTIDGIRQDGTVSGLVEIRVLEGVIENLTTDASVHCGEVTGNVRAEMSVTCGDVGGDVRSGMSVTCGDVTGSVDAGMSITGLGRRR